MVVTYICMCMSIEIETHLSSTLMIQKFRIKWRKIDFIRRLEEHWIHQMFVFLPGVEMRFGRQRGRARDVAKNIGHWKVLWQSCNKYLRRFWRFLDNIEQYEICYYPFERVVSLKERFFLLKPNVFVNALTPTKKLCCNSGPVGWMLTNRHLLRLQDQLLQMCQQPSTGGTPSGPRPPALWWSCRVPILFDHPTIRPQDSHPHPFLPRPTHSHQKITRTKTIKTRSNHSRCEQACSAQRNRKAAVEKL